MRWLPESAKGQAVISFGTHDVVKTRERETRCQIANQSCLVHRKVRPEERIEHIKEPQSLH